MSEIDAARCPWAIYAVSERPSSKDKLLLCEALEIFCEEQWGLAPREIVSVMDSGAPNAEKQALVSTIGFLGREFLHGRLRSYARAFGGGDTSAIPTGMWEIDDFVPRFSRSAIAIEHWSSQSSPATHWIFVDAPDFESFMNVWCAGAADGEPAVYPVAPELHSGTTSILRIRQVAERTGLSRSTIYAKITAGTFPSQVLLGSRIAGWYADEVDEWVRARRLITLEPDEPTTS